MPSAVETRFNEYLAKIVARNSTPAIQKAGTVSAAIPAVEDADTEQTTLVGRVPVPGKVTAARIAVAYFAIPAHATNRRAFTLVNKGQSGVGTTEVAVYDTTTGNAIPAYVSKNFVLSSTPADLAVAEGDVLICVETTPGTGQSHFGGRVEFDVN